jgi:hypothetical protein
MCDLLFDSVSRRVKFFAPIALTVVRSARYLCAQLGKLTGERLALHRAQCAR